MSGEKKRILFITSTRADFGKLKSLITEVEKNSRFDSRVFVTGMHTLARYGYTLEEVQKAGFRNIFTYINQIETAAAQMDLVLANTIQGLGHYLREFPCDLMVIHGDRVEALAGAIVGALNNVLVAHIEGGELSGTVDELIRHSVSKLSHLHFVANEEAAVRLRQMGEMPESIFVIGSPDIDVMLSDQLPSLDAARARYDIDFCDYVIFTYHPVTTELRELNANIAACVAALQASGENALVIYPNNDNGADRIMDAILPLTSHPRFRVLPSMRFEYFLTFMKHARALIGNSSAGIREAPVYGVPTINIGTRQLNRFCHSTIINVPEDYDAIIQVLRNLPPRSEPSHHFGGGGSAAHFMDVLGSDAVWETPRQKQFRDLGVHLAGPGF